MPTYSYVCNDCGDRFDAVQSFTDDALTVCKKCSGHLRKLFNSVGIVFKGSGFYRTDSRSGSVDAAHKSDSGTSSGKSESTASTTDSGAKTSAGSTSSSTASSSASTATSSSAS